MHSSSLSADMTLSPPGRVPDRFVKPPDAPPPTIPIHPSLMQPSPNTVNVSHLPLHRRVKIDGMSGRFLRSVITALSGVSAGSAHILIDLSLTPAESQSDPHALAAMIRSIGCIFGLSCDLLVCHEQTVITDFSQGEPIMSPTGMGNDGAGRLPSDDPMHGGSSSFSLPQSNPMLSQHSSTASNSSYQLNRPLSNGGSMVRPLFQSSSGDSFRNSVGPELDSNRADFLKKQPSSLPASSVGGGSRDDLSPLLDRVPTQVDDINEVDNEEDGSKNVSSSDIGNGGRGRRGRDDESEEDEAEEEPDAAQSQSRIPAPPPLTQVHAPTRRSQHLHDQLHPSLGTAANSSSLPYEHPSLMSQQSSYQRPLLHQVHSTDRHQMMLVNNDTFYGSGDVHVGYDVGSGRPRQPSADAFSPTLSSMMMISPGEHGSHINYARGPIFANIFIAHHLHRASQEVQDVLLQALKLKQISVDGLPVNLPAIHLCIATHCSSATHNGMSSIPSSATGISHRLLDEFVMDIMADSNFFQSFDRFMMNQSLLGSDPYQSFPSSSHPSSAFLPIPWEAIKQYVNEDESSSGIYMSPEMGQYIRDIAIALRQHGRVAFGPTPQGIQAFIHAAKCHAFFGGCNFVRPVDIDNVAEDTCCHRLQLRARLGPWSKSPSARAIIQHLIGKVLLPPK